MQVSLGAHFKAIRLAQGLTLNAVAELTGIGKPRKIAGKIAAFERGGTINDELLARLGDALGVDFTVIEQLTARFVIQRENGDYLTPDNLRWSAALENAQRCDQDEARAIQGWLDGLGIKTTVVALT